MSNWDTNSCIRHIIKADLHKAFRYTGMALDALKYMGCMFDGQCLMDTRLAMGLSIAPGVFHEITSVIERYLQARGITAVVYLDDFLIIGKSEEDCAEGFNVLIDLVRWLGFDLSTDKVELPVQNITFLGIDFDTRGNEVSVYLSERKVKSLLQLCQEFQDKAEPDSPSVKVKEIESLLGKLNFASQVVQYSRLYLRKGYALVARAKKLQWKYLRPNAGMVQDLRWWQAQLTGPGSRKLLLQRRRVVRDFFATDSCTGYGMGGFFDGRTFSVKWKLIKQVMRQQGLKVPTPKSSAATSSINYLELFAVYYALVLWGSLLSGCAIVCYTDSSSVFSWLTKQWVGDVESAMALELLKETFAICSSWDVVLIPRWLSTKRNVLADCLSRGPIGSFSYNGRKYAAALAEWKASGQVDYLRVADRDDWKVFPHIFDEWDSRWGPFDVDGCCDEFGANSQLDLFWSDFEAHDFCGLNVYANPPYQNEFILRLLRHALKAKQAQPAGTAALLVLPFWWDQDFWQVIVSLPQLFSVETIEAASALFTSPNAKAGRRKYCGPTKWTVALVRMSPAIPCVNWDDVWQLFPV